jgi:hypothetical protein
MKKYVLTSTSFIGNVTFGYNDIGQLVFFDNSSKMDANQHAWLLNNLPTASPVLEIIKTKIKGTIEEIPEDISFDAFWNKYDKKINRKRCEPLWKKLSDADKLCAIKNIKPYEDYLQRTGFRGKCDPENYFKKEYHLVDWKKER